MFWFESPLRQQVTLSVLCSVAGKQFGDPWRLLETAKRMTKDSKLNGYDSNMMI